MKAKAANCACYIMLAIVNIGLLVVASCLTVEARLPYEIKLYGETYSMKWDLIMPSLAISIEEFHSAKQNRTRLNYRIDSSVGLPNGFLDKQGSFFVDHLDAYETTHDRCHFVEHKAIRMAFRSDILNDDLSDPLGVGATSLLNAIQKLSELFKQTTVRGVSDAVGYETVMGRYKVAVSYDMKRVLPLGVPSSVKITHESDAKASLLVIFKSVTLLRANELIFVNSRLPSVREANYESDTLLFDVFARERARKCSTVNRISALKDDYRFSFKAKLLSQSELPVSLVVGYEHELATLRVDQDHEDSWSFTITNYKQDRRYNVLSHYSSGNSEGQLTGDRSDDISSSSSSCVVTEINLDKKVANSRAGSVHSFGMMLLGASQLAYLGMARVRGIDAYAYEAINCKLPIWLDAPMVYEKIKGGVREWRFGPPVDDKFVHSLTMVAYFTQNLPDDHMSIANKSLLLIELFKENSLYRNELLYTIPIYEFTWDMQSAGPTGERIEDFYSLANECLAPSTGDNHYARLNLQLQMANSGELVDQTRPEWLNEPAKRNLALTRAIGEQLSLPSTMIADLESRCSLGNGRDVAGHLAATMLLAQREDTPVQLKYLGRSREPMRKFYTMRVVSFQRCFELASHARMRTRADIQLFAYSDARSVCYIREYDQTINPDKEIYFALDPLRAPLEVYQIESKLDTKLVDREDFISELEKLSKTINDKSRLVLVNPGESYSSISDLRKDVYFKIILNDIENLNEKIAYDLDDGHLADINKFSGLGLVADDPQNKLIGAGEITFASCQEACLIDLDCRAYSTCIVGGEIQCILSSVNFKLATTVLELMQLRDGKAKLGQISEINVHEDRQETAAESILRIKKHPTCELHNKLYVDFFKTTGLTSVKLAGRLLRPVSHSDECAELCFLDTLATMRKEARRVHKTIYEKNDASLTQGYSASHCGHYFYLSKQTLDAINVTIPAEQIIGMNTDGPTTGYCVFDDGSSTKSSSPAQSVKARGITHNKDEKESNGSVKLFSLELRMRFFELDFSVLYEKSHGVSLEPSEKTPDQELAYENLVRNTSYTSEHLKLMGEFIQAGGNTASLGQSGSPQACARKCFTQLTDLWPACQSFDYIEYTFTRTLTKLTACIFNSMTMRQLEDMGQSDLIRRDNKWNNNKTMVDLDIQVWHYEPRLGLAAASLYQHSQHGNIEQFAWQYYNKFRNLTPRVRISTLALLLTVCLTMAAGFAIGMKLTRDLKVREILARMGVNANGRMTRDDTVTLVDDAPVLS